MERKCNLNMVLTRRRRARCLSKAERIHHMNFCRCISLHVDPHCGSNCSAATRNFPRDSKCLSIYIPYLPLREGSRCTIPPSFRYGGLYTSNVPPQFPPGEHQEGRGPLQYYRRHQLVGTISVSRLGQTSRPSQSKSFCHEACSVSKCPRR